MPKPTNYSGGSGAARKRSPTKRSAVESTSFGRLLVAFTLGILFTLITTVTYFYFGHPPVAVTDKPALWEHLTATVPLHHRLDSEARQPPFSAGEDSFEAAARIYRTQCAQCHGAPGHESALGRAMLPHAQQFFGRDNRNTATKPTGALFWVTNYGVRRSGMPAYSRTLSNTDLWNLALLLHSANQELPDPVRTLLTPNIPSTAPTNLPPLGRWPAL